MKKKSIIILCVVACIGITACKKYLDVAPKASLSEEQMFKSETGFQRALTGIYTQLAGRNLYGDKLTMGFVSTLAQNYVITNNLANFNLVETKALNYQALTVQTHTEAIWSTAYSAIAGLNKILQNTDENRAVLSDQGYAMVRGEALALRGLLHFDLVRLFGKDYVSGPDLKAIPYKTSVTQNNTIPSTTRQVIDSVLVDLKKAEDLLKTSDPIVTLNTRARRNRLNYFGVKALEARVRIYMGDKSGAAAAAAIVTNSGKYPFIIPTDAAATADRDRLYLTEQVFMLRVPTLTTWVDGPSGYFRANININAKLTLTDANFRTLYELPTDFSTTDIRFLHRVEIDGGSRFPSKYWQTTSTSLDSARRDAYVPVIRLAEMYYILAESAPTLSEGFGYLNAVRTKRGLSTLATGTQTSLDAEILKEYQKEFYAEGQLWYYYKRKRIAKPQFVASSITLTPERYTLPIPPSELEFNPNY